MRIANVPRERRSIFAHNDVADLARKLDEVPEGIDRVIVIFDGIFSMRGDNAPLAELAELAARHDGRYPEGSIFGKVTATLDRMQQQILPRDGSGAGRKALPESEA